MSKKVVDYSDLKKKMTALREQMQNEGERFLKEESNRIFSKYPKLESFSWIQYTPYFNDGDECVFSVDSDPNIVYDGIKCDRWGGDEEDEDGNGKKLSEDSVKVVDDIRKELNAFIGAFEDEDLKAIFGDHVEVIVTPKGATTETYDHD